MTRKELYYICHDEAVAYANSEHWSKNTGEEKLFLIQGYLDAMMKMRKSEITEDKKKKEESEKTLEARLVREIEARGGMALKYTSQFHRGIPDRICLLPGGFSVFVELKSTGKKPTKLQQHAMDRLDSMGHPTMVIDSTERLEALLQILDVGIAKFAKN